MSEEERREKGREEERLTYFSLVLFPQIPPSTLGCFLSLSINGAFVNFR